MHASDKDDVETLLRVGNGRGRCRLLGADSAAFEVSLSLTTTRSAQGDRRNLIVTDMTELLEAHSSATVPSTTAAPKTSSWHCWATNCAIRWARSPLPPGCSR